MEISVSEVMFFILAGVILVFSVLTVTSRLLLRAAVYLLTVLLATAGLYLLLNYEFLAAIQVALYAGGILVLIVFSILLTSHISHKFDRVPLLRKLSVGLTCVAGVLLSGLVILQHEFVSHTAPALDVDMHVVGRAMLSTGSHGYILPFEVMAVLLLGTIIGSIIIAKRSRFEK